MRSPWHVSLAVIVFSVFLPLTMLDAGQSGDRTAVWPTTGWKTSAPEEQGMDSRELARAVDHIAAADPNVHSLLVVRNGRLVMDAYFHPFGPGRHHDIASNTKSITAMLIGAALEQGLIKDVGQPALDYFPGRTIAHLDESKKAMTLADLLTMRSGLTCINRPTEVTLFQMIGAPDWVQFMLDLPMSDKPGTKFMYSSGAVHLLSAIIRRVSGRSALDFARERLFGPLGISEVVWPAGPQGDNCGWGAMRLLPHDMAKIGYLYLRDGVWEGKRLLPSGWVKEATKTHVVFGGERGYGYLWWIQTAGSYTARGRGGQYILALPGSDLIIVMTGGGSSVSPETIADDFILPAVKRADGPLPADPAAAAHLASRIRRAAEPPDPAPEPVQPLNDAAKRISGRTFVLDQNPLGLLSMTLTFDGGAEARLRIDIAFDTDRSPEYRIGLDGVPRTAAGRFGMPAEAKGQWMPDGSFLVQLNEIGNINNYRLRLTVEGDALTCRVEEATGLGGVILRGRIR